VIVIKMTADIFQLLRFLSFWYNKMHVTFAHFVEQSPICKRSNSHWHQGQHF